MLWCALGSSGLSRNASGVFGHRVVVASFRGERAAETVVGLGQPWIERDRVSILDRGVCRTSRPQERAPQTDARLDVVRLQPNRLAVVLHGLGQPPVGGQRVPEIGHAPRQTPDFVVSPRRSAPAPRPSGPGASARDRGCCGSPRHSPASAPARARVPARSCRATRRAVRVPGAPGRGSRGRCSCRASTRAACCHNVRLVCQCAVWARAATGRQAS